MWSSIATTERRAAAPANGISAGRWKAAPCRTCGSCRRAGSATGDAVAQSNRYGTTLRVYDPGIDAWHIAWTEPVGQTYLTMIGQAQGKRHRAARQERGWPDPALGLLRDHA